MPSFSDAQRNGVKAKQMPRHLQVRLSGAKRQRFKKSVRSSGKLLIPSFFLSSPGR